MGGDVNDQGNDIFETQEYFELLRKQRGILCFTPNMNDLRMNVYSNAKDIDNQSDRIVSSSMSIFK